MATLQLNRSRVAAKVAKRELDRIEKETGALMPAEIVRRAKSPRHPLHRHFDWNNTVAARKWRLVQAANLILSVRLIDDSGVSHRQYVNIGYGEGFASMAKVIANPGLAAEIVASAKAEIDEWVRRYQDLAESLGLLRNAEKSLRKRKSA